MIIFEGTPLVRPHSFYIFADRVTPLKRATALNNGSGDRLNASFAAELRARGSQGLPSRSRYAARFTEYVSLPVSPATVADISVKVVSPSSCYHVTGAGIRRHG